MKKLVSVFLVCCVLAVTFAACGNAAGNAAPESSSAPAPASASSESAAAEPSPSPAATDPADYLKGKTIRVVIGSTSVTGDTYLTADLVSRHLSQKYNCNIKVDPIGAGRALEEIVSTKPDGATIMMFHDMTYLGVLFGAYDATDYALEKMVVGGSFGYNATDCFAASAKAPYKTIAEMGKWMSENPTEVVRLAVEAGGVSQLGFNSIYEWVKATYGENIAGNLRAFVTGSTEEKLQALWDGNCQGIYAAATAVQEYTLDGVEDQLRINVIGLMSSERYGDKDWPTFAEQGITVNGTPFSFNKEYFVFYPAGIPDEYVSAMDAAMQEVCNSSEYAADIQNIGYMPQYLSSQEANTHIYEKRDAMAKLIETGPNFDDLVG